MKLDLEETYLKIYKLSHKKSRNYEEIMREKWRTCYFADKMPEIINRFGLQRAHERIDIVIPSHAPQAAYSLRICDLAGNFSLDKIYIIYNEYGMLAGIFERTEHDALDEAADRGLLDRQRLSEEDAEERELQYDGEGVIRLGNSSEPFDSTYLGIEQFTRDDFTSEALEIFKVLFDEEE